MKKLFPFIEPDKHFTQSLRASVLSHYDSHTGNSVFDWRMLFAPSLLLLGILLFFFTLSPHQIPLKEIPTSDVASITFSEIDRELNELDFMVESDAELNDAITFKEM